MKVISLSKSDLSVLGIINCFRKAGISDSSQQLGQCDVDDTFKDVRVELGQPKKA